MHTAVFPPGQYILCNLLYERNDIVVSNFKRIYGITLSYSVDIFSFRHVLSRGGCRLCLFIFEYLINYLAHLFLMFFGSYHRWI